MYPYLERLRTYSTNPLSAHQVCGCGWVWMGVAAARHTSDERPPLFYDHFDGT